MSDDLIVLEMTMLGLQPAQAELLASEITEVIRRHNVKEFQYMVCTMEEYIETMAEDDEEITIERLFHS